MNLQDNKKPNKLCRVLINSVYRVKMKFRDCDHNWILNSKKLSNLDNRIIN